MRVHYLINGLGTGGAERSLAEMLLPLSQYGIEPLITCLYRREEGVQTLVGDAGFRVRFLAGSGYISRIRALRETVRDERFDLTHSAIEETNLIARLAGVARRGVLLNSLVNTTYAKERRRDPNVRRSRLEMVRSVDGWTARHLTSHFHAISNTVKQVTMESLRVPADRITVIQRGRDAGRLGEPSAGRRVRTRAFLGLRDDDEVVVNVGRQEFQKGQERLISAIAELATSRPRIVLLIAGRRGHATSLLEGLVARKGLVSRVRFLGHRDDVPDVLAAADLFAFPSVYEGMGGSVIEAMALGLPIVASDIPAMREILEPGRNAYLVSSGSERAWANAIGRLLDQPERARSYGERGRAIFSERFALGHSVDRMWELYKRLVGGEFEQPMDGRRV